jgi:hypothetical protein
LHHLSLSLSRLNVKDLSDKDKVKRIGLVLFVKSWAFRPFRPPRPNSSRRSSPE